MGRGDIKNSNNYFTVLRPSIFFFARSRSWVWWHFVKVDDKVIKLSVKLWFLHFFGTGCFFKIHFWEHMSYLFYALVSNDLWCQEPSKINELGRRCKAWCYTQRGTHISNLLLFLEMWVHTWWYIDFYDVCYVTWCQLLLIHVVRSILYFQGM